MSLGERDNRERTKTRQKGLGEREKERESEREMQVLNEVLPIAKQAFFKRVKVSCVYCSHAC